MKTCSKTVELGSNHVLFNICEEATQKPLAIAVLDLRNGQIGDLLVDSKCREQGIGTSLIEALEEYAKEKNLMSLHTVVHPSNAKVRSFFEKLGYTEWIKMRKNVEK